MSEDYTVMIEDMPPTREEMINILNKIITEKRQDANTPKGIEIDVNPEWTHLLQNDGSIIWAYEKLGWKVMWYNQKFRHKPTRSWLSFKNAKNKGKK